MKHEELVYIIRPVQISEDELGRRWLKEIESREKDESRRVVFSFRSRLFAEGCIERLPAFTVEF